jgi:hypothetical protein
MRDLKELHWRSRGPRLPQTVLDAATLRIGAPLPDTYRQFLSQVDGGKIGRGGFKASERDWVIGGFFPFADAAGLAEKLRKSGKLPNGYLPVAYSDSPDKPLVYLELHGPGRMFLKPSTRTRWEDAGSVTLLGESFAEFLCLLGDVPKDIAPPPADVEPTNGTEAAPAAAPAPTASTAIKRPAPAPVTTSKPITSPAAAAARAVAAAAKAAVRSAPAPVKKPAVVAAPTPTPKAAKPVAKAKAAPKAKPAPKAKAKPATKAAKPKAKAKAKPAAKAKAKPAKARR